MTQFSSKTPFNDDPEPWVRTHPDLGYMGRFDSRFPNDAHSDYRMKHSPRPEFNRPQHNPTNPILTEFRRSAPWDLVVSAALELGWIDFNPIPDTATPEQVEHARKVLTKIRAVFG